MPIIEWNEQFVLGVPEFDEHHQHLVMLLNKTYDDFINGASKETLSLILDELIDYATYHFAAEEHWMKVYNYPKLSKHHDEHEYFSSRVVAFQKAYVAGEKTLSLEVLAFLKSWLSVHILGSDAEYGEFAVENGCIKV